MSNDVLIVDDSGVIRQMVKKTMEMAGLNVRNVYEASNGIEALAQLNDHQVAVMLVDINMPTMNGVQLLTRMKENGKAIIGMKVYGAGRLVNMKDECLEFHTGAGFIDSFTLGIENYEQLKDIQQRLPEASVRA